MSLKMGRPFICQAAHFEKGKIWLSACSSEPDIRLKADLDAMIHIIYDKIWAPQNGFHPIPNYYKLIYPVSSPKKMLKAYQRPSNIMSPLSRRSMEFPLKSDPASQI